MTNNIPPITVDNLKRHIQMVYDDSYHHVTRLELDEMILPNTLRAIRKRLVDTLKAIANKPPLCATCRCSGSPLPDVPTEKGFDVMCTPAGPFREGGSQWKQPQWQCWEYVGVGFSDAEARS